MGEVWRYRELDLDPWAQLNVDVAYEWFDPGVKGVRPLLTRIRLVVEGDPEFVKRVEAACAPTIEQIIRELQPRAHARRAADV